MSDYPKGLMVLVRNYFNGNSDVIVPTVEAANTYYTGDRLELSGWAYQFLYSEISNLVHEMCHVAEIEHPDRLTYHNFDFEPPSALTKRLEANGQVSQSHIEREIRVMAGQLNLMEHHGLLKEFAGHYLINHHGTSDPLELSAILVRSFPGCRYDTVTIISKLTEARKVYTPYWFKLNWQTKIQYLRSVKGTIPDRFSIEPETNRARQLERLKQDKTGAV
jgi:hypothetical protein